MMVALAGVSCCCMLWLCPVTLATAATVVLVGTDGAFISLNGEELGRFPLHGPLTLEPGRYVVRSTLKGYAPYKEEFLLEDEDDWLRLRVRLTPLKRKTAVLSNILIAGSGQRYMGRRTRGWIYTGLEITGLATAIYGELSFQNHHDDYLLSLDEYHRAVSEEDIAFHRTQAEDAFDQANQAQDVRDIGLVMFVGSIVVSMLDAWLFFPQAEVPPAVAPTDLGSAGDNPAAVTVAATSQSASGSLTLGPRLSSDGTVSWYAGWRTGF